MSPRTHIVLLSPFFYPEPISTGKYNTHLAKALSAMGVRVTAIAHFPIYPDWKPSITHARMDGIDIIRGGRLPFISQNVLLRRLQLELTYLLIVAKNRKALKEADIIVSILPPMFFTSVLNFCGIGNGAKSIAIVHDIQGVMGRIQKGFIRKAALRIIRYCEGRILNSFKHLVFLSDSMAKRAHSEYSVNLDSVHVAYPFQTIGKESSPNRLSHLFASDHKHIVYSGALGEKQCPQWLLDFFRSIVDRRKDIHCHIFSRGPAFSYLQKTLKDEYGQRILFHDLVPEKSLPELYRNSTVQIIPQARGTSDGAIPSKLPNILSAGCPVFCIADAGSEMHKIITSANEHTLMGNVTDSWDSEQLSEILFTLMDNTGEISNLQRQRLIKPFADSQFSIHRLVNHILS